MEKHFIAGDVPSSKNSKQKTKTGLIISSNATLNYEKIAIKSYIEIAKLFQIYALNIAPPYHFTFQFVRQTKREFDYINMAQIVQDMLIKASYIFWLKENLPNLFNEKIYIQKTVKGKLTESLLDINKTLKKLETTKTSDLERIYKQTVNLRKSPHLKLLDDNTNYLIPHFAPAIYDKANAGVNIYFGFINFWQT